VEEVVPRAQLRSRAGEVAEHCAGLAPDAVLATRDALRRGLDLPLAAGLALERRLAHLVWD
jgi:enoyl-CoA hydratase/carnithine racemase